MTEPRFCFLSQLLSNEIYFNQFHIEPFDFSLYVKMDSSAAQALHIVSNPYESGARNVTLTSILDKCRTAQVGSTNSVSEFSNVNCISGFPNLGPQTPRSVFAAANR